MNLVVKIAHGLTVEVGVITMVIYSFHVNSCGHDVWASPSSCNGF
jgi:hypothetical protein